MSKDEVFAEFAHIALCHCGYVDFCKTHGEFVLRKPQAEPDRQTIKNYYDGNCKNLDCWYLTENPKMHLPDMSALPSYFDYFFDIVKSEFKKIQADAANHVTSGECNIIKKD
jgi:hypothetical protein